jgi:hypothetical protein
LVWKKFLSSDDISLAIADALGRQMKAKLVLCGGNSLLPGMKDRLGQDLATSNDFAFVPEMTNRYVYFFFLFVFVFFFLFFFFFILLLICSCYSRFDWLFFFLLLLLFL